MRQNWQVSLGERIDAAEPGPIYMQIIQAVIRDIESGRLAPGTFLPSSRELARIVSVNRKTVVLAYEDLIAQGWLESAGTRGTRVAGALPETRPDEPYDTRYNRLGEGGGYDLAPPPAQPLAVAEHARFKLDEGSPDGRLFPPELLIRANRTATHRLSRCNQLQYRDPRGTAELRSAISAMLRAQRGLLVNDANICITRGSQNGIFLASMALLKPGDRVIVEAVTYEPAVAAFRALGARIVPVGLDEAGLDIDEVEAACLRHPVRAVFVTPHHQFPTTVAMKPERRLRLVELARRHGFAIIEDDYDHEFHFESQPLLPIAAYAPEQVVYVGSMSKLLLPSLRVGYIAGPERLIDALAHYVSLSDGMGNTITEQTVSILIENGELRRHARKAKLVYADRRAHFAEALRDALGDRARFAIADGGLAFWVRFKGNLDRIERQAHEAGLRFATSRSFVTRNDAPRGLRLGFASINRTEADQALAVLRDASA